MTDRTAEEVVVGVEAEVFEPPMLTIRRPDR